MDATYISANQFSVEGNKTGEFLPGRRIKVMCSVAGVKYLTIFLSSYSGSVTTVITKESELTSDLFAVLYGIVSPGGTGSIPDHTHDGSEGSGGSISVSGTGGGASTFLDLADTPSVYDEGKYLCSTASGTEWVTISGTGGGSSDVQVFLDLSDTPATYSGSEGKYLRVTASGIEFEDLDLTTFSGTEVFVAGDATVTGTMYAHVYDSYSPLTIKDGGVTVVQGDGAGNIDFPNGITIEGAPPVSSFLDLTDTPSSYTDASESTLMVMSPTGISYSNSGRWFIDSGSPSPISPVSFGEEDSIYLNSDNGEVWLQQVDNSSTPFSGNILRVGSGQPYATINAAYDAASAGDIILIEPGSYDVQPFTISKHIHLKGNASSPLSVALSNSDTFLKINVGDSTTFCNDNRNIYIEGIHFWVKWDWRHCIYFNGTAGGVNVTLNKCKFGNNVVNTYCISYWSASAGNLFVKNCMLDRGYAHGESLNGSFYFQKTQLAEALYLTNSVAPQENDTVTVATDQYGYDYGTWQITDEDTYGWFNIGKLVTNFTELSDTPSNYDSGKLLVSTSSGIEFTTISGESHSQFSNLDYDSSGHTGFAPAEHEHSFLSLTDTPTTFSGTIGQYLQSTGSGIEWTDATSGAMSLLDLTDTPTTYSGAEGKYLKVTASGIEFADVTTSAGGTSYHDALLNLDYDSSGHTGFAPTAHEHIFLDLEDTPSSYDTGKYLCSTSSGIEFVSLYVSGTTIGKQWFNDAADVPADQVSYLLNEDTGVISNFSYQSSGWLYGWDYRNKITIDHTKVDETLTDFPVLVKLTAANFDFAAAKSGGEDIRFTSSDGETLLKYERERHDSVNEKAEYHVKVPSVSSSADTEIYIYYGKADASDGEDAANVWDDDFIAVWHLSTLSDSTSNSLDLSIADGSPVVADGKIAKGYEFTPAYRNVDRLQRVNSSLLNPANITLEVVPKTDNITTPQYIAGKRYHLTSSPYNSYNIELLDNDAVFNIGTSSGLTYITLDSAISTGTYYHLALTYDKEYLRAFINGVQEDSVAETASLVSGTEGFWVGATFNETDWYFDGIIDEVRISSTARSAAWIKATYHSLFDTITTAGSTETLAIEETILGTIKPSFTDLIDAPTTYSGSEGKYLKVTASGIEFADVTVSGGGTSYHDALLNLDYDSSGHTGFAPIVHEHSTFSGTEVFVAGDATVTGTMYARIYDSYSPLTIKDGGVTAIQGDGSGAIDLKSDSTINGTQIASMSDVGASTFLGLSDTPSSYVFGEYLSVVSSGIAFSKPIMSISGPPTVATVGNIGAFVVDHDSGKVYKKNRIGTGVLARTIVIDIANNWGDSAYSSIRSIEFKSHGILISIDEDLDVVCYGPSYSSDYEVSNIFDTSLSKIGFNVDNNWIIGDTSNIRLICVFNFDIEFDEMIINNGHKSGTETDRGVKDIIIYSSTDAYTATTYGAVVPNSTVLFDGQVAEHVALDVADDQTIFVYDPTDTGWDIVLDPGSTTFSGLSDAPSTYEEGKYLRSTSSGTEWATVSGVENLVDLSDTPSDYGTIGQYLQSTGSGIEWADVTSGAVSLLDLTDTPATYSGSAGKYLYTTSSGIDFIDGVILTAPNNSKWLLRVTNSGTLYTESY